MTFIPGLDLPIPEVTQFNTAFTYYYLLAAIWANILLHYLGGPK